jgi:fibronectin type III domain protein
MSAFPHRLLHVATVLLLGVVELPVAWALDATPTGLSFNAIQGGANPTSQIVNVLKGGRSTATWKTSNYAAWLTVSPGSGTITKSTAITVSAQASGLKAGTYTTTIKVAASAGGNVWIPVTFTVMSGTTSNSTSTSSTSSGSTTSTSTSSGSTSTSTSGSTSTTATLSWYPNAETNLAGYKVHIGTAAGIYNSTVDVRNVTSYSLPNLAIGTTYYFAVSAYDTAGTDSALSNEVSKSIY